MSQIYIFISSIRMQSWEFMCKVVTIPNILPGHTPQLPLSVQASLELQQLGELLTQIQMNQQQRDEWTYIWRKQSIHIKQILQIELEIHSSSNPFSMDLENQGLKEV
jgi:hypothetical protein